MMFDLKSASVHGRIRRSRARVLWRHGRLKIFDRGGLNYEVKSKQPARLSGFLSSWLVETDAGPVVLKGKCLTCGGPSWWRIMRLPANELWEITANG